MYLYGLRNVHLVDFNMRKAPAWHLFKILIVAVKQIGGIHTNADGALHKEKDKVETSKGKKLWIIGKKVWNPTKVNCAELNKLIINIWIKLQG